MASDLRKFLEQYAKVCLLLLVFAVVGFLATVVHQSVAFLRSADPFDEKVVSPLGYKVATFRGPIYAHEGQSEFYVVAHFHEDTSNITMLIENTATWTILTSAYDADGILLDAPGMNSLSDASGMDCEFTVDLPSFRGKRGIRYDGRAVPSEFGKFSGIPGYGKPGFYVEGRKHRGTYTIIHPSEFRDQPLPFDNERDSYRPEDGSYTRLQ